MSDLWIIDKPIFGEPKRVRTAFGDYVEYRLEPMNCGGTPVFDTGSGCAYRCERCGAVIGSKGQPQRCKDMNE